jgi:hypothetical protein
MVELELPVAIFAAFFFVAAVTITGKWIQVRARKRAAQLEEANRLLNLHYDALESVLVDAAAPEPMKTVMREFSDAICDHAFALRITGKLLSHAPARPETEGADVFDTAQLRIHRPDLADAMEQAIRTGIMAMFLRWPEPARAFELLVSRSVDSVEDQLRTAQQMARHRKEFLRPAAA